MRRSRLRPCLRACPWGVPFRRVKDERKDGCFVSSEDSNYWTIRMQRVRLRLHEAPLPPLDRGDHCRGDPACARGPGAGGALCRDRGLGLPAELLEPHGHQREGSAQVDALAALQRAPGGRPDPQRAPRRRDAELVPLRGDRTALSRTDAGHPRCARRAAEDRLAAGARGQAQTRGSVDVVPPLRVHGTGSARQARASVAGPTISLRRAARTRRSMAWTARPPFSYPPICTPLRFLARSFM